MLACEADDVSHLTVNKRLLQKQQCAEKRARQMGECIEA
jgi:hypothetical protein